MAESNQEPPLCPCGFWGSPHTSGLCSKCYREQAKRSEDKSGQMLMSHDESQASSLLSAFAAAAPSLAVTGTEASNSEEEAKSTDQTVHQASVAADSSGSASLPSSASSSPRPVQKKKNKCFKCKQRLELAFTEIGRCKCEYVFCEAHRLPELHDCVYNHKEMGRQEALTKMISPKKHIGTSLKRLDSDH